VNQAYGQYGQLAGFGADPGLEAQLSRDIDNCWRKHPRRFLGNNRGDRNACINAANRRADARAAQAGVAATETRKAQEEAKRARRQAVAASTTPGWVWAVAGVLVLAGAGGVWQGRKVQR